MKLDLKEITGLTLIDKIIEFVSMTSDPSSWTFEKQNTNPPRLIRLKQLNVLLKLFLSESFNSKDLRSNIQSVISGDFILYRDIKLYDKLFLTMDEFISRANDHPGKRKEWTSYDLKFNYKQLIKYKINLNKLLEFNSGIMEISYPYFYSVILTNEISHEVKFKNLDKFLASVIDPADKNFSKDQLIKDNNYPDVDVYDVDLDNW